MSTILAIDWGDVPTWIGATTTLGALIAAGAVVRIELRRDKDSRERLERADQADKVAAWSVQEQRGPQIRLRNGSDLPIFMVVVMLVMHPGRKREGQTDRLLVLQEQVVPPGDTHVAWPEDIYHVTDLGDTDLDRRHEWHITVAFHDASNRRWFRSELGSLERGR